MKIMIDYDGTYTADVEMWRKIVYFMACKHEVYLVTSRDTDTPIEDEGWWNERNIPIIYCAYRAKKDVCLEQGVDIDIWIDNDPYYITTGFITDDAPLELLKMNAKDFQ